MTPGPCFRSTTSVGGESLAISQRAKRVSADDRNHRGATGPPTTALATVGSPPIKIRVVERGLGAEADEPTLHMQMAGLARLLASPGFGDLWLEFGGAAP